MFYYPEEAAQQYTVNKFDDAEKGGQGLAEMVKSVADQSIQVCWCASTLSVAST